ncbi:MAG TPA: MFS transporter [Actinomycetota bacterium]|nr:MFS transporter [Actinomycetota bacterium]
MDLLRDTIALFRNRDFRSLMGAQWFAQAADGIVGVALAKHITFGGAAGLDVEAARTPREALLIVLLTFLPYTLFSPLVGVLIDRWNRRRLLIGANAARVAVLAVVAGVGIATIGDAALYVSFLLILAGTRLVLAIRGAGLPVTLGERRLLQGNAISQAGSALFQLGGAGAALVATGFVDTRLIVGAGVLVYLVATLSAAATRQLGYVTVSVPLRQELRRVLSDVADGVREVARHAMAALSLASFLTLRSMLTFVVLGTVFVSRGFIAREGTLTSAIPAAAGALGAAVGFVVATALKDRVRPDRLVAGALLLGGTGMVAFGGIVNLAGITILAAVVGLSFFLGKVAVDTLMQQALADAFRGRGFSFQDVAYNLSWVVPALVLFLVLTPARARMVLIGGGVAFLLLALLIGAWARRAAAGAPAPAERSAAH